MLDRLRSRFPWSGWRHAGPRRHSPTQSLRELGTRLRNWRTGSTATSEAAALAGLRADNPQCRWKSAAILARNAHRSEEAIEALIQALADSEEFVRWEAAKALAAQEAGRIFPVLTMTLADPELLRRAGAAEALGYLGGEAATVILCKHLADPEPDVRVAIASALRSLADPTTVSCLLPHLSDADPDMRRAVGGALGRIGNQSTAKPMADALSQPGQPLLVRRALAAALVRATHPDAQPALLAALADPDPQVRGYAAQALGQIGNETAYAALTAARSDSGTILDGTVGDQVKQALTMLERRGRTSPPSQNARDFATPAVAEDGGITPPDLLQPTERGEQGSRMIE